MDIRTLAEALIFAMVCAICAAMLRQKKKAILTIITDLVQKAENAVEGSKMGQDKKDKVIAQLEAMGYTITGWMDTAIDEVVKTLNEKKGWLTTKAVTIINENENLIGDDEK